MRYEEVYPGIDLVYYGKEGQLEYDFIVAPGADPNVIALEFDGADKLELDGHGDPTCGPKVLTEGLDRLGRVLRVALHLSHTGSGPVPAVEPHPAQRARPDFDTEAGHHGSQALRVCASNIARPPVPPCLPRRQASYHVTAQPHVRSERRFEPKLPRKQGAVNRWENHRPPGKPTLASRYDAGNAPVERVLQSRGTVARPQQRRLTPRRLTPP